jgi:hypothetical protein
MKWNKFLIFMILVSSFWSGCKKDSTTDTRDPFVATYSVTETWTENSKTMTKPAFIMSVEKSSIKDDGLLLNNFANYGAGITADAKVAGKEITISLQTLPNSRAIIGSGVLADTLLTISYTETNGANSFIVTATAKKK